MALDHKYGVDLVQQCMKDLTHQWSMLHWEIPPTYGKMRTPVQQHEVERRIRTEAGNAFCEALERVREWITEGGGG